MNPTRILIVEDETIVAMDLESQLKAAGHEVMARVTTAEEALELATANRPDLVLMDITLAGRMDGVEAAGAIRRLYPAGACPPIIALTANAFAEDRQRYLDLGLDDYLAKPFDRAAMTAVLDRWTRQPSAAQCASSRPAA